MASTHTCKSALALVLLRIHARDFLLEDNVFLSWNCFEVAIALRLSRQAERK